jgi:glycosyltransferase involved in cell wall biosynthesis
MTVSAFLKGHIAAASEQYDVSVVANTDDGEFLRRLGLDAVLYRVAIVRRVSPWRDLLALLALVQLFRSERFAIVHSISPKAGLLAMLAASITGTLHRVHTFTGQVWVTRRGWRRWLLKQADRLLAALTTRALVDSPSQRDFLIAEQVIAVDKAEVIGKGSICGVDGTRFRPDEAARSVLRNELGISSSAPVLLFLGRLNRDKGLLDLAAAFACVATRFPETWLLFVGPDEEGMADSIADICVVVRNRVQFIDYTPQPEHFMAAADIFCLPSYREGFGMVVIEAAAAGLPAVASRIYGITDAVVDGQTGLLHPPGDVVAIAERLTELLGAPERCKALGARARVRALADFSQFGSSQGLLAFYAKILAP